MSIEGEGEFAIAKGKFASEFTFPQSDCCVYRGRGVGEFASEFVFPQSDDRKMVNGAGGRGEFTAIALEKGKYFEETEGVNYERG